MSLSTAFPPSPWEAPGQRGLTEGNRVGPTSLLFPPRRGQGVAARTQPASRTRVVPSSPLLLKLQVPVFSTRERPASQAEAPPSTVILTAVLISISSAQKVLLL